jgi:hypothetical protein
MKSAFARPIKIDKLSIKVYRHELIHMHGTIAAIGRCQRRETSKRPQNNATIANQLPST